MSFGQKSLQESLWNSSPGGEIATHKRVPEDLARVEEPAKATSDDDAQRWAPYLQWMSACWQGRAAEVVASLRARARERGLGSPVKDAPETDPCVVVSRTITYVTNNVGHMDYPRYRRLGLPVTNAAVESPSKNVNYWVKGTGKPAPLRRPENKVRLMHSRPADRRQALRTDAATAVQLCVQNPRKRHPDFDSVRGNHPHVT